MMETDIAELLAHGLRAEAQEHVAEARQCFLGAVRNASQIGDESSLANALCGLARAESVIGNCEASRIHFASAAILYRRNGSPQQLAYALRHEAGILNSSRYLSEAYSLYREAESIYRAEGERYQLELADTLCDLALLTDALDRRSESTVLWSQARDLYARCGLKGRVAECEIRIAAPTAEPTHASQQP
jgi:tetratricopeptide (TPR) repeat protein